MFKNKGFIIDNILHLTPSEAFELCSEEATLVDVREEFMIGCKKFDVPQTIYCPASNIAELHTKLPKFLPLIIADATGIHSKEIVLFLIDKGLNRYKLFIFVLL